jgi:type VI secretion system protein ImpK
MQDAVADLVFPIVLRALELKERLDAGADLAFEVEQGALQGMLLTPAPARSTAPFGVGEEAEQSQPHPGWERADEGPGQAGPRPALGIRYVLACWLDEFFINHTPWSELWNERKLETALYSSNDRAWKFWEQARQSERRADSDTLEAFYLCVMLGFRGDLSAEPAARRAWVEAAATQHAQRPGRLWSSPPEAEPPTSVPPLRSRQRLRRAVLVAGMLLLVLVPLLTFFFVQQARQ